MLLPTRKNVEWCLPTPSARRYAQCSARRRGQAKSFKRTSRSSSACPSGRCPTFLWMPADGLVTNGKMSLESSTAHRSTPTIRHRVSDIDDTPSGGRRVHGFIGFYAPSFMHSVCLSPTHSNGAGNRLKGTYTLSDWFALLYRLGWFNVTFPLGADLCGILYCIWVRSCKFVAFVDLRAFGDILEKSELVPGWVGDVHWSLFIWRYLMFRSFPINLWLIENTGRWL